MNQSNVKKQDDLLISRVLRSGVFLALIVASIGGALFLWLHGHEMLNYSLFEGEPFDVMSVRTSLFNAHNDHCINIMELGILLLIATPIARVASCVYVFARQRDYLYVAIALIVLMILLFSFC